MECHKERKVSIASFLLRGRALNQRESYTSRQPQGATVTWADFRREYYWQYFTDRYQDQKRREFTELKQGSMSVADYEAAFIDLSRFAYVANEREKCQLFQDGLNLPI